MSAERGAKRVTGRDTKWDLDTYKWRVVQRNKTKKAKKILMAIKGDYKRNWINIKKTKRYREKEGI